MQVSLMICLAGVPTVRDGVLLAWMQGTCLQVDMLMSACLPMSCCPCACVCMYVCMYVCVRVYALCCVALYVYSMCMHCAVWLSCVCTVLCGSLYNLNIVAVVRHPSWKGFDSWRPDLCHGHHVMNTCTTATQSMNTCTMANMCIIAHLLPNLSHVSGQNSCLYDLRPNTHT